MLVALALRRGMDGARVIPVCRLTNFDIPETMGIWEQARHEIVFNYKKFQIRVSPKLGRFCARTHYRSNEML